MLGMYNLSMHRFHLEKSVHWKMIDHEAEYTLAVPWLKGSCWMSDNAYLTSWLVYCIDAVSNIISLKSGLLCHLLLSCLA
jgi:hypothetical protein